MITTTAGQREDQDPTTRTHSCVKKENLAKLPPDEHHESLAASVLNACSAPPSPSEQSRPPHLHIRDTSCTVNSDITLIHDNPGRYKSNNLIVRSLKLSHRKLRRMENDRLAGNPYIQAPLACDLFPIPTHCVKPPNYFAVLFDINAPFTVKRAHDIGRTYPVKANSQSRLSKNMRNLLKRSSDARFLVENLEKRIRNFLEFWRSRQHLDCMDQLALPSSDDGGQFEEILLTDTDSDDAESFIWIGSHGETLPINSLSTSTESFHKFHNSVHFNSSAPSPTSWSNLASPSLVPFRRNLLVIESDINDRQANFRRWLVHSIGVYYGLQSWSETVGYPARRRAYISVNVTNLPSCETSVKMPSLLPLPNPISSLF